MYEIIFYEDKNGKSEVADFIEKLNENAKTSKECRININKIIAYMDVYHSALFYQEDQENT